jgi:glycosyltransferase involved in cell wall biosynthesis
MLRVLLVSPCCFTLPVQRYGGIEALIWDFAEVLPSLGVETVLAAPKGSKAPKGCKLIETVDLRFHSGFGEAEVYAYEWYRHRVNEFDVVHDFSHSKVASTFNPALRSINIMWFEPVWFTEQRGGELYPMPHNVVALSSYQAEQFKKVYGRQARHQPTICRNADVYKPVDNPKRERFLFVGKMSWHKGCLQAIKMCKELGEPLDIVGGYGVGDPPYYRDQVISECDDKQVCFYPNVTDDVKVMLMQNAKAVLYPLQFPESHNMVLAEAGLCGTAVVTFNRSGMPEVVEHGVTGFLANSDDEFKAYMKKVENLDSKMIREAALKRYDRKRIAEAYLELYKAVSEGLRW